MDDVNLMFDGILNVLWPMAIACVVIFTVGILWRHFWDGIFAGVKKLLGLKRSSTSTWRTLDEIKQKNAQK